MKHIFIVNPKSGNGLAERSIQFIRQYCADQKLDFELLITEMEGQAKELASRFHAEDSVCLYAVGGDGTAYDVANGLNDRVPLAIIPAGTSNDFFRMISDRRESIEQIIEETIRGRFVNVDLGSTSHSRFLNCTTMGLDARVNDMVNRLLKRSFLPRMMLYGVSAVINVFRLQPFHVVLDADGRRYEEDCILLAVMNGKAYGNGVIPIKGVDLKDGLLNICMIQSDKLSHILPLLPKYMSGHADALTQAKFLTARSIHLQSDQQICMQSDGETFYSREEDFRVDPGRLILRVPASSAL